MAAIRLKGLVAVIAGLAAARRWARRSAIGSPGIAAGDSSWGCSKAILTGLNNGPVMNGSAIEQTITVPAGATLSFNYAFLTNEPVTLSAGRGQPVCIRDEPEPGQDFADTFSPLVSSPHRSHSGGWTGYDSFSETFATAGTYTLGIGVANVTDKHVYFRVYYSTTSSCPADSIAAMEALRRKRLYWLVDNRQRRRPDVLFTGIAPPDGKYQAFLSTASVPEPSSVVLLTLGGLCAVAMAGVRAATGRRPLRHRVHEPAEQAWRNNSCSGVEPRLDDLRNAEAKRHGPEPDSRAEGLQKH